MHPRRAGRRAAAWAIVTAHDPAEGDSDGCAGASAGPLPALNASQARGAAGR